MAKQDFLSAGKKGVRMEFYLADMMVVLMADLMAA